MKLHRSQNRRSLTQFSHFAALPRRRRQVTSLQQSRLRLTLLCVCVCSSPAFLFPSLHVGSVIHASECLCFLFKSLGASSQISSGRIAATELFLQKYNNGGGR